MTYTYSWTTLCKSGQGYFLKKASASLIQKPTLPALAFSRLCLFYCCCFFPWCVSSYMNIVTRKSWYGPYTCRIVFCFVAWCFLLSCPSGAGLQDNLTYATQKFNETIFLKGHLFKTLYDCIKRSPSWKEGTLERK